MNRSDLNLSDAARTEHRRTGAQPAASTAATDPGAGDNAVAADIRRGAIDRMMRMNALHAGNAWDLRRRDPIAAHGLAFLFAQPDERPGRRARYRLSAATKLWLAGEHDLDLPGRLFRYHHGISESLSGAGVDVRDLADRRDPEMADGAVYVGLGVSSLDTSSGSWAEVVATASIARLPDRQSPPEPMPERARPRRASGGRASGGRTPVTSEHDVPGSIWILLTDDTTIFAERRGMPEFNQRIIHSTGTLNYTPYDAPYPWSRCTRAQLDADPAHAETLRWMGALGDLLWQADEARLVAGQSRMTAAQP